ncbi:hypothetical protein ACP275_12G040600 [Erythranthe tilingii]
MQPQDLVGWCKDYMAMFRNSQFCPNSRMGYMHPSEWIPPPSHGVIKVNFDAALPHAQAGFSIAGVAMNDAGQCLCWKVEKMQGNLQPVECKAIIMAKEKRLSNIIIEMETANRLLLEHY